MERRFVRFEIKRVVEYDQEDGSGHYYKMVEEGQEPDDGLWLWGLYGYDSAGELQWLTDSQSRQWLETLKEYMEGLVATQEAAESAARSILEFVEGGRKGPEDWYAVVDSLRHAHRNRPAAAADGENQAQSPAVKPSLPKALWAACRYLDKDHTSHAKGRCPWKIDPGKLEAALESAGLMALPIDQIHMEDRGMIGSLQSQTEELPGVPKDTPAGIPPADPIQTRSSWGADLPEEFKARPFGKALDGLWWAIDVLKARAEEAEERSKEALYSREADDDSWLWELTPAELANALEDARILRWVGGMDGHWEVMGEPGAKPCDIQCLGGSYPSDNTGVMRFLARFSESGWKEGNATISYEVTPDKKVYRIGVEFRPDQKG